MHLINIIPEVDKDYPYLRNHGGNYYGTKACELNSPIPGLLGDMQVSLLKDVSTYYPKWAVQCKPDGSRALCTTSASGYETSLLTDLTNEVTIDKKSLFPHTHPPHTTFPPHTTTHTQI